MSGGVSQPGACDQTPPSPCRSPPPPPGTPRLLGDPQGGRTLCMGMHWAGASGDTGYTLPWEGPPQSSAWSPHGCPGGASPGPWVFLVPLRGASQWCDRSGLGPWAARRLSCRPGVSIRDVCARWCWEGHTQVCTRPLACTAHTWATNRPVRPRACLGLPCSHVLVHVCWPHTRTWAAAATLAARFTSLPTNA